MKLNICINGFGRIGRIVARELCLNYKDQYNLVLVNDLLGGAELAAYLMEFDSIHGRFPLSCTVVDNENFEIESYGNVAVSNESEIKNLPLEKLKIDIVIECTGKHNDVKKLEPYKQMGIKKIVVSAPVKNVKNIVVGVNDDIITKDDYIVTAASCTTNCIAPVIKVIDEAFGIEHGLITTIHNVTNTQSIMDATNAKKSDLRRARSGMLNLAPTSTGSAKAVGLVFPHLQGKLDGIAVRVPLQNASITDMVFTLKQNITPKQVNEALKKASEQMPKILGYETKQLVSTDYINDPRSSIVDAQYTLAIGGNQVKILAWYDNEYAYSLRCVDILKNVSSKL